MSTEIENVVVVAVTPVILLHFSSLRYIDEARVYLYRFSMALSRFEQISCVYIQRDMSFIACNLYKRAIVKSRVCILQEMLTLSKI